MGELSETNVGERIMKMVKIKLILLAVIISTTIGQNWAKENKYQDEINKFYDTSSEFNPALEPYVGNNNVDLNSNGYKESVKLYNYGMDLAKELNEMVSQMEDQTNSKIYKISKPRYSLNDFWTNLDHGHDNLDLIKRADLSKNNIPTDNWVKLFMMPRRKKFSIQNLTGTQMKYLLKNSQFWKPRSNTKFVG